MSAANRVSGGAGKQFFERKAVPSSHQLTLFADYFQFVAMDVASQDDFSSIWTDEALACMVAAGESAVSFGTLRNVDVRVDLHVVSELPLLALDDYDHVVEGSFALPTGALAIMGCMDFADAHRMNLASGHSVFIDAVKGVDSITEESAPADDLYTVFLAPGPRRPLKMLKHWQAKPRL